MRRRKLGAAALAAWCLLTLSGCGASHLSGSQLSGVNEASSVSPEPESSLVAVRAYSAGFSTESERTDGVPADVVLFEDGLVVADVGEFPERRYVAVNLTQAELDEYITRIDEIEAGDLSIPYDPTFHTDSGMTIIGIQDDGKPVEIAVALLLSHVVEPADVPQFAIDIDLLLTELKALAVDIGQPYAGDVPTLPGVLPDLDEAIGSSTVAVHRCVLRRMTSV